MLGRLRAVSVEEGLRIILENLPERNLASERINIEYGLSRILAEDIYSKEDLPGFDRSSVDGYAVISSDTFGASETTPLYLELSGEVKMGEVARERLHRGRAIKIPTGGMLPEGSDAVIMLEHTAMVDENLIEILKPVAPGENVIKRDEDIKAGQPVLKRGHKLRPHDIGALAGLGITEIEVYKRPIVSIISTGDEIIPPHEKPSPGQVRDINSYNLAALVIEAGAIPVRMGIIRDDYSLLKETIKRALESCHVVLISGGSSVGTKDFTARAIDELGKPGILFHGVAMKPGKPTIAAIVNDIPVFGIPGHPAAATVCFINFIKPVIKRLSGNRSAEIPKTIMARLTKNIPSQSGRTDFVRVRIIMDGGTFLAEPVFGKSGLITTLIHADGLVIIPPEKSGIQEGERVEVILFE
ncbi:MAG: molybdopterin molybdotransferase MoeA [Thermodesulfovibrionales bacterium]|nr:molybdopterin molybdotransferase MoeA [Thermodesulfovibrionales bacterium]